MNNISTKFQDCTFHSDVTSTYCIFIGPSSTTEYNTDVYKVVNKDTEVVEAELSILAKAYRYCLELEEELNEMEHHLASRHADYLTDAETSTTEH